MKPSLRIALVGSGNVATAMGLELKAKGALIVQVFSKNIQKAKLLGRQMGAASCIADLNELTTAADVYLVAVRDDVLPEVAAHFSGGLYKGKIIFHTSGSQPSKVFEKCEGWAGVIYPLQTFTKGYLQPIWDKVPLFIEPANVKSLPHLKRIARLLSNKQRVIAFEKRIQLHLAAVFINNFTNHLLKLGDDVLRQQNLELKDFEALIGQTVEKALKIGPAKSQTGPARRKDKNTIKKHLDLLKAHAPARKVYQLFSTAILNDPDYV